MQNARRYPDLVPTDILMAADPAAVYARQLVAASRLGIRRQDFVVFAKKIKQSVQSLAEVIPASYSTLTKKSVYDQETSERIYEIAQVYAQGKEVFGSIDKFNHWMEHPSIPLGGDTPFSLLDTSFGIELVRQEIGRIDHGIFA